MLSQGTLVIKYICSQPLILRKRFIQHHSHRGASARDTWTIHMAPQVRSKMNGGHGQTFALNNS